MIRLLATLLTCAAILLAQDSRGIDPATDNNPAVAWPVGKWFVEFTNGVSEVCRVGNVGEASVEEPQRQSHGTAVLRAGSVILTFNDDRVERWTAVRERFVVEHWFPGSGFPSGSPVLGIAGRTP